MRILLLFELLTRIRFPPSRPSLEWTTSAVLGDGGNLKVKASSDLNEDALKRMPTLTVEKHWSTDV